MRVIQNRSVCHVNSSSFDNLLKILIAVGCSKPLQRDSCLEDGYRFWLRFPNNLTRLLVVSLAEFVPNVSYGYTFELSTLALRVSFSRLADMTSGSSHLFSRVFECYMTEYYTLVECVLDFASIHLQNTRLFGFATSLNRHSVAERGPYLFMLGIQNLVEYNAYVLRRYSESRICQCNWPSMNFSRSIVAIGRGVWCPRIFDCLRRSYDISFICGCFRWFIWARGHSISEVCSTVVRLVTLPEVSGMSSTSGPRQGIVLVTISLLSFTLLLCFFVSPDWQIGSSLYLLPTFLLFLFFYLLVLLLLLTETCCPPCRLV